MQYFRKRWKSEGGYREFLVIAVPLILSTGAWAVQHFVDRMFLSWYSAEAIAAALPAGILNFCIMSLFIGTASYVSTFVAQYYGAGSLHRIGPAVWQGVYVSIFGGIVLICLIPFALPIFSLVAHDPLTQRYEVEYFRILCLGAGPLRFLLREGANMAGNVGKCPCHCCKPDHGLCPDIRELGFP